MFIISLGRGSGVQVVRVITPIFLLSRAWYAFTLARFVDVVVLSIQFRSIRFDPSCQVVHVKKYQQRWDTKKYFTTRVGDLHHQNPYACAYPDVLNSPHLSFPKLVVSGNSFSTE